MVKASDYLIALDDGHGIGTAGKRTPYIQSLGRQIRENEFNEKVTFFLKVELERCGFRTMLTAPTDEDTPLKSRTDLANSMRANALVSNQLLGCLACSISQLARMAIGQQAFLFESHSDDRVWVIPSVFV